MRQHKIPLASFLILNTPPIPQASSYFAFLVVNTSVYPQQYSPRSLIPFRLSSNITLRYLVERFGTSDLFLRRLDFLSFRTPYTLHTPFTSLYVA